MRCHRRSSLRGPRDPLSATVHHGRQVGRRELIRRGVVHLGALAFLPPAAAHAGASSRYAQTLSTLRRGVRKEMVAHHSYVKFTRRAETEGYQGIAYLFTTLATSELIHAQNYNALLAALGSPIEPTPALPVEVAETKTNLIAAANAEIRTIDKVYPELLKALDAEKHQDALRDVRYAWESHKQHRDMIKKIRRWSPLFFEKVARRIDEKADQYYVCQICGSTLDYIPKTTCTICGFASSHYRRIDPGIFLR